MTGQLTNLNTVKNGCNVTKGTKYLSL